MIRHTLLFIVFFITASVCAAPQPTCTITYYDAADGLSPGVTRGLGVQDKHGFIWFATWFAMNRFDGYGFDAIRHIDNNGDIVFPGRINEIRRMSTGDIWCRVDERCMLFDVDTYRFTDILTPIEKRLRKHIDIGGIRVADDGSTVMRCKDGSFLTVDDSDPIATATLSAKEPHKRYVQDSVSFKKIGAYDRKDVVYARRDKAGIIWVITKRGEIYYTTDVDTPLTRYDERLKRDKGIGYLLTDNQDNVWIGLPGGVARLTFGQALYEPFPQDIQAEIRCAYSDSKGRLWVAARDTTIRVLAPDGTGIGYLRGDGRLQQTYTSFGSRVYCIAEDAEGNMWFGTKHHGLFRLRQRTDDTYDVKHFLPDPADKTTISSKNVYDLCVDRYGRLWIATFDGGINCAEDVSSDNPLFLHRGNGMAGYPAQAMYARRAVIVRDSILMIVTQGGLVVADINIPDARSMRFVLHANEPDRRTSLNNARLMDIIEDSKGHTYVVSESGGLSRIRSEDMLADKIDFEQPRGAGIIPEDFMKSVIEHGGQLWIGSGNSLIAYDPASGAFTTYGSTYWGRNITFSEARPLHLSGGSWLFGVADGGIVIDLDSIEARRHTPQIVVTAISVENKDDSIAVAACDTVTLTEHERNITIRFAALDYKAATGINYAFKTDDDNEWTNIGKTRSVTLLHLQPGKHTVTIRSTDDTGQWLDNEHTLTLFVTPQWWETTRAKVLYVVIALVLLFGIIRAIVYVQEMRAKQKETLNAYMLLLDERTKSRTATENARQNSGKGQAATDGEAIIIPVLSDDDKAFMKRAVDFIETNIHETELSINALADATATSPSSLNRKMKRITNVTPAEFVKRLRLQRAATLLETTDRAVNTIAFDCGFSDQNYFGKCFKKHTGFTPTEYRKRAGK